MIDIVGIYIYLLPLTHSSVIDTTRQGMAGRIRFMQFFSARQELPG